MTTPCPRRPETSVAAPSRLGDTVTAADGGRNCGPAAMALAAPEARLETAAPLVLVADDDAQQRLLMAEALTGAGIDVVEAADGEEALKVWAEASPDLILLDVVMPGIDGFDVCTRLRGRPDGEHVPVLMVTGLEDVASIDQAFKAGATDFITKPIKWSLLSNRVRYALRTSETEKELRITRDALQASERHFRALAENSLDLISILDRDGKLLFASQSIEALSGYAPEDIAGKLFFDFVHADDHAGFSGFFRRLADQPDATDSIEFRFRHKREGWRTVEAKCKNLLEDPSVRGIFLTSRDITKRKEAERRLIDAKIELELADKAKSFFLANMSHELRTPLNPIVGFSELLMSEDGGFSAKVRDYAAQIHTSGQHMLQIINDILEQTRVETGKIAADKEPAELAEICNAALRLSGANDPQLEVTLDVDIEAGMPRLHADPRLMRQILANLVSNSIKFTPAGGTIQVSAAYDAETEEHVLSVRDNGIGIARGELAKVLTPFYQVDQSLTRKRGGTGLGLALVNSFVKLHGGTFTLDSELGEGTVATCRFPNARPASARKPKKSAGRRG